MKLGTVGRQFGVLVLAAGLAACGGGGFGVASGGASSGGGSSGGSSSGGSSSGGGTTATGIPAVLTVTSAQPEIAADGKSTALLTAVLTDTANQPIPNFSLNFQTTAGTLVSNNAATDATGSASVRLTSSKIAGRATVTVNEPKSNLSSSVNVNFGAAPAAAITLSAAPLSVTPGGVSSVQATVLDAGGNPVVAEPVTLSVPSNQSGGQFDNVSVTTDNNGRAQANYTAGATVGTDTLSAKTAGGLTATAKVTVSTAALTIGKITLAAGSTSVVADGSSKDALTATIVDASGAPIPGVTINFTSTAGAVNPATATTDSSGIAQAQLTAPTQVGNATATASSGGFSASQQVSFIAGAVKTVALSVSPANLTPGGTASLRATVLDANANPVSGTAVTFSSTTSGTAGGATFSVVTVNSDANGYASSQYNAPTSSSVTSDSVTAKTAGGVSSNAVAVSILPTFAKVGNLAVTALTASIPADGTTTATVRAQVTDSGGAAIQGVSVDFTSTAGTPASGSKTTDASGNADFVLTAATVPGTAKVTASTGGFSGSANVQFTAGTPGSVTLALNPASVAPNGSTTVRATVLDTKGNPAPGVTVNFSVPSNNSHGTLGVTSAVTDTNGAASTTYTAGNVTGSVSDTIQARIATSSVAEASATLAVTNQVKKVSLISSAPQLLSSASTLAQGVTLTALVKDQNNNVVANVPVQFAAKLDSSSSCGNGGALQVVSGTTDSTGTATATLYTGGDPTNQNIEVSATAGGISASLSIPETGTHLNITGAAAVGLSSSTDYTVTLTDAGNNPIIGQAVNATSALGNGITSSNLTTDSNGQVVVSYAATNGGSDTLTVKPGNCATYASSATKTIQVATQNLSIVAPNPNTQIPFAAMGDFSLGATVSAGGSGYAAGDVLTMQGAANTPAQLTVSQVSGGVITAVTVTNAGDYTALPTSPAAGTGGSGTGAMFNLAENITVKLTGTGGAPLSGKIITFNTTRGTLLSSTAMTAVGTGLATVAISQSSGPGNAGGAVVTATCTNCSPQISASASVQFNATTPASVKLQANPSTVPIDGTSTITATLRDANNNLVANQLVQFTLTDNSGGGLLQSSGTTNSSGQVVVTYKAGGTTSSGNGVLITGTNSSIASGNPTYYIGSAAIVGTGTGYVVGDVLTVQGGTCSSNPCTTPNQAQLKVVSVGGGGAITAVTVTNGGTYSFSPTNPAPVTGGTGTSATFNLTPGVTIVNTVTLSSAGTDYVDGDALTVQGGTFTTAAQLQVVSVSGGGAITAFTLIDGGTYTSTPTNPASVTGGTGTGAAFVLTPRVTINSATPSPSTGTGYVVGETLTVQGGTSTTPAQLKVVSVIAGGAITAVTVANGGTYTVSPSSPAPVTGGAGTGALFKLTSVKNGTVALTVGGQSLRIVLGTGNTITALNTTQYQLPYSVLVTDASGNPPPAGSVVNLVVNALSYQKGVEQYNGTLWVPIYAVDCTSDQGCSSTASFGCSNEDINLNGIFDPGEDYNGNGFLDPGNVTSVPASVTLDVNGTGQFNITYSKDRAYWIQVFLTATIKVNGEQGATTVDFVLPGLSSDFTSQAVSPPGQTSPYRTASSCADPN